MTVDWVTQVVTIPQGDLTFVSGTLYTGDTNALRILIKEEEASEVGIVFQDINRHNTEVGPIVGTTYARTIEIINGYSLTFDPDSAWSVQLEGSNNNMWDVGGGILNQNNVQVIPSNSAGLIVVTSGSGVTEQDKLDIADRVWDELLTAHVGTDSFGEAMNTILRDVDYEITSAEVVGETHLTIWTDASQTVVWKVFNIGTVDTPKRIDVTP